MRCSSIVFCCQCMDIMKPHRLDNFAIRCFRWKLCALCVRSVTWNFIERTGRRSLLSLKTIRSSWWWFVYAPLVPIFNVSPSVSTLFLAYIYALRNGNECRLNLEMVGSLNRCVLLFIFIIFGPPMFAIKYKFQFIKSSLYGVNSLCLLYRYYTLASHRLICLRWKYYVITKQDI